MRLTHQTDYGLRMLMQLAVNTDSLVTISEVSERYNISKNHLMKVAQLVVHEGWVEPVRGRNGSVRRGGAARGGGGVVARPRLSRIIRSRGSRPGGLGARPASS